MSYLEQTASLEKPTMLHQDVAQAEAESLQSNRDIEKTDADLTRTETRDDVVTFKTWVVVWMMALSYGASFWPVPFFSTIQSEVAVDLGSQASSGTW